MDRAELSLLIKITRVDELPLPYGVVNDTLVTKMFHNDSGIIPLDIKVINIQFALVDLSEGTLVFKVSQGTHGYWHNHDIYVFIVF